MPNANRPVTVKVPANLNLEQAQQVLASVLNKVGHPACYSGFNLNFVNVVDPSPIIMTYGHGGLKVED